jgi:general secretion pathway protein G
MRTVKSPDGFTLIELVVVVLVLGIIAAVAAPKMFDTANDARETATRQNLAVVRDAIELYRAQQGKYPTTSSIQSDLAAYIRGPFPAPAVGADKGNSSVTDNTSTAAGWLYNATTGSFRVRDSNYSSW